MWGLRIGVEGAVPINLFLHIFVIMTTVSSWLVITQNGKNFVNHY